MKRFARLFAELDATTSTNAKVEALQRYFDSPAPKQYAEQRKPFEHHLRTERAWGAIDFSIG